MEDGVTMCDSAPIFNIPNNSNNNGDIINSNNINKVRSRQLICLSRGIIHTTHQGDTFPEQIFYLLRITPGLFKELVF